MPQISPTKNVTPTLLTPPQPTLVVGADNYTVTVPTENLELLTSGTPEQNKLVRDKFINDLLVSNASLLSGKKLLMDAQTLHGSSTIITKRVVRIVNSSFISGLPIQYTFDLTTLLSDEAIYIPLKDIGDFIIITSSSGNKIKFKNLNGTHYNVYENYTNGYENYKDVNTPVSSVLTTGDTSSFDTFTFEIGSIGGEDSPVILPLPVPNCFPKGTPVTTDQGKIAIETLNPDVHTIRGKKVVAITKTVPLHKHIISIEKHALRYNVPSATTQISMDHKILYKGVLTKAKDLVPLHKRVTKIPYNGETLYNVLMDSYEVMTINNLVCETLHPENIMAKIYNGSFSIMEKNIISKELICALNSNDVPAFKKLYNSLTYFTNKKLRRKNVDIQLGFHGIGSKIYTKHF